MNVSLRTAAGLGLNALHECIVPKGAETQISDAMRALRSAIDADLSATQPEGFQARYRIPDGQWSSWGHVVCGVKGHEQELRIAPDRASPSRALPVAWAATDEDGNVEALGMNQSRRFDTPLYTRAQHLAAPLPAAVDVGAAQAETALAAPAATGLLHDEDALHSIERAADLLEGYAEFIKSDVMAADIERHPYLPEVEGVAEELRELAAQAAPVVPMTQAARDVLAERQRQISAEGWTAENDDQYKHGDMSAAAAAYATQGRFHYPMPGKPGPLWPWPAEWWKPTTYRRNLEKAGALILAEIERLDRATPGATHGN